MAKNDTDAQPSDHLKYYCIVFGVLVVVIGVVALMQRSTLKRYQQANRATNAQLKAKGTTSDGRPRGTGELAVEVEKFVDGYRKASGGGGAEPGISNRMMEGAERAVNVTREWAGTERDDPDQSKGHRTIRREFKYKDCSLEQLVQLMRNIETNGRFRVFDVRWQLADARVNSKPPMNLVTKPAIKVGYRTPITRDR